MDLVKPCDRPVAENAVTADVGRHAGAECTQRGGGLSTETFVALRARATAALRSNVPHRPPIELRADTSAPIEWAAASILFWRSIVLLRATCEKVAGKSIDIAAEWSPIAARVLEAEDEN